MPSISQEERDKMPPVWDLSQERVFIETLVNQRLNFFLVTFSIVIAGALNTKVQLFFQIIILLGAILCSLLAWTIYRGNQKLGKILKRLKDDNTHPITLIDNETKGPSVRWIIGKFIPIGCSLFLFVLAIISLTGAINIANLNQIGNTKGIENDQKIVDSLKLNIITINMKLNSIEKDIRDKLAPTTASDKTPGK